VLNANYGTQGNPINPGLNRFYVGTMADANLRNGGSIADSRSVLVSGGVGGVKDTSSSGVLGMRSIKAIVKNNAAHITDSSGEEGGQSGGGGRHATDLRAFKTTTGGISKSGNAISVPEFRVVDMKGFVKDQ